MPRMNDIVILHPKLVGFELGRAVNLKVKIRQEIAHRSHSCEVWHQCAVL